MFELLFLPSPSDKETLSTYFQIQVLGAEIFKFANLTEVNKEPVIMPLKTGMPWTVT